MARIKSALELALERTDAVKSDKEQLEAYELRQEGKKLASAFLQGTEGFDLEKAIKGFDKQKAPLIREAVASVFLMNIGLPSYEDQIQALGKLAQGFSVLSSDKSIPVLFKELEKIFQRYFQDITQLEAMLKEQLGPKLRQKEQEMARRTGQRVRIDPMQDPEFVKVFSQQMGRLKSQYQAAVDQAREELRRILGVS